MSHDFEPALHAVDITTLRPTQMTVGFREVARKRQEWSQRAEHDGRDFLGRHMVPVIQGPADRLFVIDNHHLALALHLEGVPQVLVKVVADLSKLDKPVFWTFMDNRNWLHPFDVTGQRRPREDLPKTLDALGDDPYRSLAGELRHAGGYAKDETPYSEFLWADFLRRRVDDKVLAKDFSKALEQALVIAHEADASYLPGWCGPHR